MIVREWPAGHRLFSEGGYHLAFDPPPEGEEMPAILLRIDAAREVVEVLRVASFSKDEDALAWFAEERRKRAQ
jgi:hypothetical protein